MDPGRSGPIPAAAAIALILFWAGAATSEAAKPKTILGKFLARGNEDRSEDKDGASQNVFSRPDRASVQRLTKAQQLMEQGRYAEAVGHLGAILESAEDYFLPDNTPVRRSLRLEAQRLLGQMPRAGRELYELQYGARARQMLTEAVAAGDAIGLAEVSRRFFHTRAGYEATLLLGLYHLDRASPLAGALTLERLQDVSPAADDFEPALSLSMATCWLRAGMPEKAKQTLARLKNRHPGATVQIGGKSVPLFADDARAVEWLAKLTGIPLGGSPEEAEQWAMARGNPARNASVTGSGPLLSLRWRVPVSENPHVEAMIDQLSQSPREQDRGIIPGLQPLAVGNTVLMRTTQNLLAVDFATGKRIWEVPDDDPYESLMAPPPETPPFNPPMPFDAALRFRVWGDATFGTISSDGQRVFAIEDLSLEVGMVSARQFPFPRSQGGPRPYNRLAAFNVRNGKLEWHVGGSPEEFGLPLAGTFFLGPPLPLMGRLYVMAESKGEIRLLALDAKNGSVLWTQQLAVVDRDVLNDPLRRLAGVSPSYAEGILVCPTSNKSIVALDLATRSLLWGYTYPERSEQGQPQLMFPGFRPLVEQDPLARCADANVTLAEGRVLATPPDSDRVHCLNLADGKFLWKEPREEDLYLACVHQGKAILVGRHRMRALKLDGGQPAWKPVEFPSGSAPSGWGFLSGDLYYVPLSSAEVMAVDVKAGRVAHVSKSRQGSVPGNLVCFQGRVISQRPNGVEVFYQVDALRKQVDQRLAANAKDAEAVALRGEILWDEGKLPEAIACFRRSLEMSPDLKSRNLLRDALFEGLRTDFAAHRKSIEEIERLIDGSQQQATLFWLLASGCENAREYHTAFGHYLKLIDLDRSRRDQETVDKFLSVRRDRWIQVQLAAMREASPPEVKAEIDRESRRRLKAASEDKSSDGLARFLDYFGSLPVADQAQEQLTAQYRRSGRLLQAELLLRRQEQSGDPRRAAGAVAQLAAMLNEAKRVEDAAVCYRRLEKDFADVACLDGKTPRQWVDSLPPDSPVRRLLQPASAWPVGEVLVERSPAKKPPPETYSRATLEYAGSPSPFFSDVTVEYHQNPPQIVARDGLGNRRWQLSLTELMRRGQYPWNRGAVRAAVRGHLMLVSLGQSVMAVDTLGTAAAGSPRVLWTQDLDDTGELASRQQIRIQAANLAGGIQQRIQFGLGRPGFGMNPMAGLPGVVTEQLVCFQRFRSCVAVHTATGEMLWARQDVHPDSVIFGDDQYVFVVPPNETAAAVLRALDGKLLGRRQVPPEHVAFLGRYVLVWRDTDSEVALELIDPWDDHKLWAPRTFSARAKYDLVDNELLGVFEPEGRFVLLELASGRIAIEAKLQPERTLAGIHVLRSPDGYVLVTNSAQREDNALRRTYALHGMAGEQISRGRAYGFGREGKLLWPAPVKIEDQFLLTAQPRQLPVVAFACMAHVQKPDGSSQQSTAVLCIDRHNGRVLCREEFPNTTNTFQLVGDAEKKTVELQLQRETVTMTFTDKPVSANSPPEGAVKPKSEAAKRPKARNLLEALERAAEGAVEKTFRLPPLRDNPFDGE